jgi:hypothetical protein
MTYDNSMASILTKALTVSRIRNSRLALLKNQKILQNESSKFFQE